MKKHKITLGLLLILAIFAYVSPSFTYADENDAKCKKFVEDHVKNFADKYGVKLDSIKSETENNVVLSMDIPKDKDLSDKEKSAAVFKITKIEIGSIADEKKEHIQQTFTTDQLGNLGISDPTLKNGSKIIFAHPYETEKGYHITLEPVNYKDAALVSNCGENSILNT